MRPRMSLAAEKVAEMLALPAQDRAYLVHQLIASLDPQQDNDAEAHWHEVIDHRSREIEEGKITCRSVDDVAQDIGRVETVSGRVGRRPRIA